MKWYDVNEKLPPVGARVLVVRELHIDCLDHPVQMHDIGILRGTCPGDRWTLDSERFSPLKCEPMLCAHIITH